MQLEFGNPSLLYLLYGLPLWALLVWPRAGGGVFFSRGEVARGLDRWWGTPAALVLTLPRFIRAAALVTLVLALADPQRVEVVEERSLSGKGIGLLVDLSSSMLARDMEAGASRIDVARSAATRFAEGRELDELSLVGFAGRAVTRVPPTTDPNLVVAGVGSLEIQLVGDGTDISSAILTGLGQLMSSQLTPRVLVLLTDGAHNGSGIQPLAAARAAAALEVRVHAISILGPEDPAARARREAAAKSATTAGAADMQTVLSAIADLTGGRYFHASTGAALDSIYAEINRLEAPSQEITHSTVRHSERVWLLLIGLALLGADVLLRGSRWGIVP